MATRRLKSAIENSKGGEGGVVIAVRKEEKPKQAQELNTKNVNCQQLKLTENIKNVEIIGFNILLEPNISISY